MTALTDPDRVEKLENERVTHLFFFLCSLMMVLFFTWAYYGRLDVVSVASGEVIPSTRVKHVQHLEGGIVSEIFVLEGDEVKKGQALMSLEPISSGADVEELQSRITSLKIDVARLKAETANNKVPQFPEDLIRNHSDLVGQALELFKTRKSRIRNQLSAQKETITQRNQEINEIISRIENAKSRLKLLDEQVKMSEDLLKDQLTNRMQHLELLKEVSGLKGLINEDRSVLRNARAGHKGAINKLDVIQDSFHEEARKELDQKRRALSEFTSRVRKFEDSLRRTTLRSPVDGVVKSLHVVTIGGVLTPGMTAADIVPGDDKMIVEARLPPQEIGYVHAGQEVLVTLSSSDSNRFGNLEGKVLSVSPDTITSTDGAPYYQIRITTEKDYFQRKALRYQLVPGVQVTASIRTGQRSVLSYIVDPLLGEMDEALRER